MDWSLLQEAWEYFSLDGPVVLSQLTGKQWALGYPKPFLIKGKKLSNPMYMLQKTNSYCHHGTPLSSPHWVKMSFYKLLQWGQFHHCLLGCSFHFGDVFVFVVFSQCFLPAIQGHQHYPLRTLQGSWVASGYCASIDTSHSCTKAEVKLSAFWDFSPTLCHLWSVSWVFPYDSHTTLSLSVHLQL